MSASETPLKEKHCVPCRGGIPPLGEEEARRLLAEVPGWELAEGATRLRRTFRFPDFATALRFVNQVGALAESEAHHPDLCLGWGYVTVTLYTHKIGGLHENDFILAARIGELAPEGEPPLSEAGRGCRG